HQRLAADLHERLRPAEPPPGPGGQQQPRRAHETCAAGATARSASIRAAVANNGGTRPVRTDSGVVRLVCVEMCTAATTLPDLARMGAATDRSPSSNS